MRTQEDQRQHGDHREDGNFDLPGKVGEDVDHADQQRGDAEPHEEDAGEQQFKQQQDRADDPPTPLAEKGKQFAHGRSSALGGLDWRDAPGRLAKL